MVSRRAQHGSPRREFRISEESERRSYIVDAIRPSDPELPGTEGRLYQRFAPPSHVGDGPLKVSRLAHHGSPRQTFRNSVDPFSAEMGPSLGAQPTQSGNFCRLFQRSEINVSGGL